MRNILLAGILILQIGVKCFSEEDPEYVQHGMQYMEKFVEAARADKRYDQVMSRDDIRAFVSEIKLQYELLNKGGYENTEGSKNIFDIAIKVTEKHPYSMRSAVALLSCAEYLRGANLLRRDVAYSQKATVLANKALGHAGALANLYETLACTYLYERRPKK